MASLLARVALSFFWSSLAHASCQHQREDQDVLNSMTYEEACMFGSTAIFREQRDIAVAPRSFDQPGEGISAKTLWIKGPLVMLPVGMVSALPDAD
jgi:hypothetical protein